MKMIKISMLIFAGLFAASCQNGSNTACKTDSVTSTSSATTNSELITAAPAQDGVATVADTPSSGAIVNSKTHNNIDGKVTASSTRVKRKHHPYDGTLPQSSSYSKKEMQQVQAGMGADNTSSGVTENATNVVPSKSSPNGVKVITK